MCGGSLNLFYTVVTVKVRGLMMAWAETVLIFSTYSGTSILDEFLESCLSTPQMGELYERN